MSVTDLDVRSAAAAAGIPSQDVPYWEAIVEQESGGSYDAYANQAGAVGPAQKVGYPLPGPGESLEQWARGNLLAGAQEFASDLRSFPSSVGEAIAAYYTGAGNVQRYGISNAYGDPTPAAYVSSVESIAAREPSSLSYAAGQAAAGLSGPGTQQTAGTAPPATSDVSLIGSAGGFLGHLAGDFLNATGITQLVLRAGEILFGLGLITLGVGGVYLALAKDKSDLGALTALLARQTKSTGGSRPPRSSPLSPEEQAAARAARERRSEEQHRERLKLTQARATEVRTRQRHRAALASSAKKEVEKRERTAYARGAEDVLKHQATQQGKRRAER